MDCARARRGAGIAAGHGPLGLFGGSFDPPHAGHVALVRAALSFLPEVWVVPAGRPVHRALSGRADARTRLEWMRRIFSGERHVRVLDWEVEVKRPVPTIETLRRVHNRYPERQPVLLLGADAFASMSSWVDYPAHLDLCDVAVFRRRGQPGPEPGDWRQVSVEQWRMIPGHGRLICPDASLPGVSATGIRARAAQGRSLRGRVPEVIRQEIEGAYRVPGQEKDVG